MEKEFITSRGIKVTFQGVATLLDKLQAQNKPPQPPQYEAVGMGGMKSYFPHDETTLKTDSDKAAWQTYLEAKAKQEREYNQALTRLVLLRGITFDYDPNGNWVKEQAFLGIGIPQEPIERRLHYIETEVIGGVADVESIMLGTMGASGVNEELLAAMAESFQRPLGASRRDEIARPGTAANKSGVVFQPTVRTGASSIRNANAAKPIRQSKRRR